MPPPPPRPFDPDAPRVLLFGPPRSGKTALLDALRRTGRARLERLRGKEITSIAGTTPPSAANPDLPPALADSSEIDSWLVTVSPAQSGDPPLTAIVYDCSGAAAESLLQNPEVIETEEARTPTAQAIARADAIALLVDASSDDEELKEAFEDFDTFLTKVSQAKVKEREVGGFPVILVLTHADKLARPGDSYADWLDRIEQREKEAGDEFGKFLRNGEEVDSLPSPFLPFGQIDLSVETVSTRFPPLTNVSVGPETPFRVAELFCECIRWAHAHRKRVIVSNRRLKWTVRLVLSLLLFLVTSILAVVVFPPPTADPTLAQRIISYQLHEGEAEVRLAYPQLTRNKLALQSFRDDPGFATLPAELRTFVLGRLQEIADYEALRAKLASAIAPADTRSLDELARVEQALAGELALPPQYAWGKTQAAELLRKWSADAAAIRAAEQQLLETYREFIRRGMILTLRPSLGGTWREEVDRLLAETARPPVPLTDPLPGSPALDHPRGQPVTYRVPYEFDRVYNARREWEFTRDQLTRLRDLGDLLGLTEGPGRPDRVLVLPPPSPGIDSTALPTRVWTALLRVYPELTRRPEDWATTRFPDPARTLLRQKLDGLMHNGVGHVRHLIRGRLGADPSRNDTPAWWRSFTATLTDPSTPFPDWGRLLHLIARLREPTATNPVTDLARFLSREQFEVKPTGFDLYLPADLSLDRVVPTGPLVIRLKPVRGKDREQSWTFRPAGPGIRQAGGTAYRLVPDEPVAFTYIPGDELRGEIPLRGGGRELRLVWASGATLSFQLDRLTRAPLAVWSDGRTEPAPTARLTPLEDAAWPAVPVLLPDLGPADANR